MTKLPSCTFKPNSTQPEQPLTSTQRATTMAFTQHAICSPPPSSTSVGAVIEGPASPVFGPTSPSPAAASEHRMGDASERYTVGAPSEHHSVAVSDCSLGATSVTMTQHSPGTLATSRLGAKSGFCPRTIKVNPNPNP
jgi:hypothetical protein